MCGRYVIEGTTELSERFQLRQIPADLFPDLSTYNAAPSQLLPVIVEDAAGERTAVPMQWGLVPRWRRQDGKATVAPINARAETLLEKPMFKNLTTSKRCIIPANGFYEWRKVNGRKQPYYLTSEDGALWGLAGLYDLTHDEGNAAAGSFTIITTGANDLVAPLHERMPAILRREDEEEWLSRDIQDPLQVERLLRPYPDDEMRIYPVSTLVNNTRHNGPELIVPDE
ncbi:MAG: SOS response-associated peptidase [Thermomicrobiales bacterium]